ncbi:flavin reductase [Myxococcota bacterium]|nr:flavin reductase [Myxococcota bacterium]MBU1534542.1 flavin reductase [Myxococcota bacterium]
MKKVCPTEFTIQPHNHWNNKWFILAAGDYEAGDFNAMTVAWGGMGTMWGKPFVTIVVRPARHTYSFIEKYPTFTLCSFPEIYKKQLVLMGSRSGRSHDKISDCGLTTMASTNVAAPSFKQADLILECKKIYWDDLKPENFLDPSIHEKYPEKDYHRMYFGEILSIWENK